MASNENETSSGAAGKVTKSFSANRKTSVAAALLGLLIGGGAMALWAGQKDRPAESDRAAESASRAAPASGSRAEIEKIVHDYILANPEIIPEALKRGEEEELAARINARRAAYETPFGGAWAGAKNGDVILVEFFDYACGYCRKSNADIARLLREDPKLKVVWRELPVLGPDSDMAAHASLAAAEAGRFEIFHDYMFAAGRPSSSVVAEAQRKAGVSDAQVATMRNSSRARQELETNFELARAIRTTGTPTFVVGDKVLGGAVGYEILKAAIAEARKRAS